MKGLKLIIADIKFLFLSHTILKEYIVSPAIMGSCFISHYMVFIFGCMALPGPDIIFVSQQVRKG